MEPQLPPPGQNLAPVPHPPSPYASPAPGPRPPAPYADSPADDDPDAPGLLEYVRILRRRKGTVLLIAFLGIVTGVLVTLPQTPVYQARASLEIQDINNDFLNMKQVNPVSESGTGYTALSDIQTQIKILQSESLVERVAAKLHVAQPRDFKPAGSRINAWRRALNLPEPAPRGRPGTGRQPWQKEPQGPRRRPDPHRRSALRFHRSRPGCQFRQHPGH